MRVIFGRQPCELPGLFSGQAWMDAAEAWALERGETVAQWRIDQRFCVGGQWFRIDWQEGAAGALGQWLVTPLEN